METLDKKQVSEEIFGLFVVIVGIIAAVRAIVGRR